MKNSSSEASTNTHEMMKRSHNINTSCKESSSVSISLDLLWVQSKSSWRGTHIVNMYPSNKTSTLQSNSFLTPLFFLMSSIYQVFPIISSCSPLFFYTLQQNTHSLSLNRTCWFSFSSTNRGSPAAAIHYLYSLTNVYTHENTLTETCT